nr:putative Gag-polypeptide of LTR copia-type [Tanacetum cinerariifolium]
MAGDNVNNDKDKGVSSSSYLNLTFGDPLYLHPNDTGGSPIVTIKLTGTENYKDMCNSIVFTWILNSLSPDLYVGAIYAKTASKLWTVKAAFAIVSGEESHRNITCANLTKPTATAFAAKAIDKKRFNTNCGSTSNNNKGFNSGSNSNNRGPNLNLKCTNCNKIGHIVDRCFEIIGYPAGYVKRNFSTNSKSVGTSNNSVVDPNSNIAGNNTASNSPVSLFNE